jgi:hypothetical protein
MQIPISQRPNQVVALRSLAPPPSCPSHTRKPSPKTNTATATQLNEVVSMVNASESARETIKLQMYQLMSPYEDPHVSAGEIVDYLHSLTHMPPPPNPDTRCLACGEPLSTYDDCWRGTLLPLPSLNSVNIPDESSNNPTT